MNDDFLNLFARVSSLERRLSGMVRHGRVAEVDAAAGTVRLNLGEGDNGPLLSPKIPYAQFAGALKAHTPPSVGQQMSWLAPSGDSRQSFAVPLSWSDANPSPSEAGDENVITFGNVRLTLRNNLLKAEIGGLVFELTGEHMTLNVDGVAWRLSGAGYAQAGGGMGHDGHDVGATHRHPDVFPGPANTGTPIANGPTP